jgi:hypothetical protein
VHFQTDYRPLILSAILIDWFANNKMKANPDKFQAIAIGNKSKNGDKNCNWV